MLHLSKWGDSTKKIIDDLMRVHLQVIKEKHNPGRSRYDYGTPSQEG